VWRDDKPPDCKVTVYEHGDFSGWAIEFGEGDWPYAQFTGRGAQNDKVSAIKVQGHGCVASCFEHDLD
jgi:hypothetical protein